MGPGGTRSAEPPNSACAVAHDTQSPSPAPAFQGKHACFHPTADGHVKTHGDLCAEDEHQPSYRVGNGVRRQQSRQRAQTVRPSNRSRKARRPVPSGNNAEQQLGSTYTPPPGMGALPQDPSHSQSCQGEHLTGQPGCSGMQAVDTVMSLRSSRLVQRLLRWGRSQVRNQMEIGLQFDPDQGVYCL